MKKILLTIPVLVLTFGFYTHIMFVNTFQDVLKQLNISEDDAKGIIWSDCAGSYFGYPNPKQLKNMATGDRAALVEVVGRYVKTYTESDEFRKKYSEFRQDRKPTPPESPKFSEQMKAEYKANLTKGIEESEKTKKSLPADQQTFIDQAITMYKQQLADLDKPDNPMFNKDMDQIIQQQYDMSMNDYRQKVTEWEKQYPENNASVIVKKWIKAFLDETNEIDFGAELQKNKWGKMVFTNSSYESKSSVWKLCFRAGKEATNSARDFAQNWLKELN